MTEEMLKQYWNDNATAWTELVRAGYDVYRDHLNTPAFFEILPSISGLSGLDIGCGEGHNTRLLTRQGARMHGIDISEVFVEYAQAEERQNPLGINYKVATANALPYTNEQFDFATSFMCLMDVPNLHESLREAYRVVKPGGFFQFSIAHPCFSTPHRRNLRNESGETYAFEVGNYFAARPGVIEEWIFHSAPTNVKAKFQKFKVPVFHSTLTEWLMAILQVGFTLECINEPVPSIAIVKEIPALQDARIVSYFLHVRCRKNNEEN
ncbi:MAG: class I SAM-dependent methyltransferase [Bacteroidetes bacterium CHB5]|nr:class I SAM-dependent methyltransferase [Bacteroidetes bacterium CHB5]